MSGWKWVWLYLSPIIAPALWGIAGLMVSEKSFAVAESLFILGNVLLATRIITEPRIDSGQRVAIITFVLIVSLAGSTSEWFWVEARRAAALALEAKQKFEEPTIVSEPPGTDSNPISTAKPNNNPYPPALKQPLRPKGPDARRSPKLKPSEQTQTKPTFVCDNALPFKTTSKEQSDDIRKPFRVWIEIYPNKAHLPNGPEGVRVIATANLMAAMLVGPTTDNVSNPGAAGIGDGRMTGTGRVAQVWLNDRDLFNRSPSVFALFETDQDFDIICVQEGPLPIHPVR